MASISKGLRLWALRRNTFVPQNLCQSSSSSCTFNASSHICADGRDLILRITRRPLSTCFKRCSPSFEAQPEQEYIDSSPQLEQEPVSASTPQELLKYHVSRTKSNNLAIYELRKRGGNLHQTVIKKVSGSVKDLQDDIQAHLQLDPKLVSRKDSLGHIIVKGHHRESIAKYLEKKHF